MLAATLGELRAARARRVSRGVGGRARFVNHGPRHEAKQATHGNGTAEQAANASDHEGEIAIARIADSELHHKGNDGEEDDVVDAEEDNLTFIPLRGNATNLNRENGATNQ